VSSLKLATSYIGQTCSRSAVVVYNLLPGICILLPIQSMLTVVTTTTMNIFKAVTSTHCDAYNFAPAVSPSIGLLPQKYFWQVSIVLTSIIRLNFALLNFKRLSKRMVQSQFNKVTKNKLTQKNDQFRMQIWQFWLLHYWMSFLVSCIR